MPSATTVPPQAIEARAEAFMYLIKRGGELTGKQIHDAQVFGGKAARRKQGTLIRLEDDVAAKVAEVLGRVVEGCPSPDCSHCALINSALDQIEAKS